MAKEVARFKAVFFDFFIRFGPGLCVEVPHEHDSVFFGRLLFDNAKSLPDFMLSDRLVLNHMMQVQIAKPKTPFGVDRKLRQLHVSDSGKMHNCAAQKLELLVVVEHGVAVDTRFRVWMLHQPERLDLYGRLQLRVLIHSSVGGEDMAASVDVEHLI